MIKASLVEKPLSCDSSSVGSLSMGNSNRGLFTEYTYSDISIAIILQIKKEESYFLSINICNPAFSMLRIYEKLVS